MLEIMAESQGKILGVKVRGGFIHQDFKDLLVPRLEAVIQEQGGVRVLLCLEKDFQGWEEIIGSEEFGRKFKDNFEKIAVVGGDFWLSLKINLISAFLAGEVRSFSRDDLQEAWDWLGA